MMVSWMIYDGYMMVSWYFMVVSWWFPDDSICFRSRRWFPTPLPPSSWSEPPAPSPCSSSAAQFFPQKVKSKKVGINLSFVQASAQMSHSRQMRSGFSSQGIWFYLKMIHCIRQGGLLFSSLKIQFYFKSFTIGLDHRPQSREDRSHMDPRSNRSHKHQHYRGASF